MNVFQVRYDKGGGSKSLGARFGPEAIERVFKSVPWRGAEDGTPYPILDWKRGIISPDAYRAQMSYHFGGMLPSFITLSGDNSCSFETVRAVARHVEHVALVVFDAHFDACDASHDPHAHWVRRLWEEQIIRPEKTVFFGIRDAEEAEARYVKGQNATIVMADDMYSSYNRVIIPRTPLWHSVSMLLTHGLVIVVDIDVLDPAYAPGTGVLRAGGLHVRHVLHSIRELCTFPFAVKIGEICEVIPAEGNKIRPRSNKRPDPCGLTVLAADAIFREMIRSMSV